MSMQIESVATPKRGRAARTASVKTPRKAAFKKAAGGKAPVRAKKAQSKSAERRTTERRATKRSKTTERRIKERRSPERKNSRTKLSPASSCDTWVAQFIYADAAGQTQVSLVSIEAESLEAARAFAAAHPPAEEFMVSVHPVSDEQFLGQVRLSALNAAGK